MAGTLNVESVEYIEKTGSGYGYGEADGNGAMPLVMQITDTVRNYQYQLLIEYSKSYRPKNRSWNIR